MTLRRRLSDATTAAYGAVSANARRPSIRTDVLARTRRLDESRPTVDKGKTKKIIMHKLRSIGKESGESVESVLKIKGRPLWEAFPEKEGIEVWF